MGLTISTPHLHLRPNEEKKGKKGLPPISCREQTHPKWLSIQLQSGPVSPAIGLGSEQMISDANLFIWTHAIPHWCITTTPNLTLLPDSPPLTHTHCTSVRGDGTRRSIVCVCVCPNVSSTVSALSCTVCHNVMMYSVCVCVFADPPSPPFL
jgi:hypothetical protein